MKTTIRHHRFDEPLRFGSFEPRRYRWPGLVGAALMAGTVGALAVSSMRDGPADFAALPASAITPVTDTTVDSGITAAVKASLQTDPALGNLPIAVDTHQGVVTLTGPAPDEPARKRATSLASRSAGVHGVDNQLVVSSAAPRS